MCIISLLFSINENTFSRKHRKYNSILAGEASAKFTSLLGSIAVFDCRICELPNKELVLDYFRWRNEDAHRNALNAYCYWKLRENNHSRIQATKKIEKLSTSEKNELLFQFGINFNNLPSWQKRGVGVYWDKIEKKGFNPKTKQEVITKRNNLKSNYDLPIKKEYENLILGFINKES